jgi:hypothetical protein
MSSRDTGTTSGIYCWFWRACFESGSVRKRTVEWHLRKVALTQLGQGGLSA